MAEMVKKELKYSGDYSLGTIDIINVNGKKKHLILKAAGELRDASINTIMLIYFHNNRADHL